MEVTKTTKKKHVENHPYVTINGVEPEVPTSFLHTKKFLAVAFTITIFMGLIMYFFIFR
jgi:hypothetical protein